MTNTLTEAHAVRIYGWAKARGWNVGLKETADALGISLDSARYAVSVKGWNGRFVSRGTAISRAQVRGGPNNPNAGVKPVDGYINHGLGQFDTLMED